MKSVGEKLRRERIQRNIDLETLAQMTRISRRYLEAIESGNTDDLPGGFFYRSFVRQYALAVGLDMDEIEADLERVREAEAPVLTVALQKAEFPVKQPDPIVTEGNRKLTPGRVWTYVVLLGAVLAGCSFFYAWWYRSTANAKENVAAEEVRQSNPTAADPAPKTNPPIAPAPVSKAPSETSAPPSSVSAGTNSRPIGVPVKPETDSGSAPATEQPAPDARAAANPTTSPDDKVVMNLTASEMVWLTVTADGKTLFTGVLNPNETKTLAGKASARVRVGNAGGLAITWNGKSIGPIGPKGQVRTVVMTPERYQIIGPTPQAAVQPTEPSALM